MPGQPPAGARESNAGDDFHILWAARQSLRLLDSRSDLKRVRLEGIAPDDAAAARQELLLGVDLTEYYGGGEWSTADRVAVSQLKYSTRRPEQAWTAARLARRDKKRGGASVAKRLGEQFEAFDSNRDERLAKLRIQLVSNQPVSTKLRSSLDAARGFLVSATGTPTAEEICAGVPAPCRDEIATLFSGVGVESGVFGEFLLVLDLAHCGASERTILEAQLAATLRLHVSDEAEHGFNALYRRILRECFPEASDSKGLTRADLLATFGVTNEEDLFPAPSRVGFVPEPIPTADVSRLAAAIMTGSRRILAHGVAGVGKTTTLQTLEAALPPQWSVVTYDCFGGGDYLSPADARHLPQRALLQMTNELALRHCQPILLHLPRDQADVWSEFQRKVAVVAQELASKGGGIVLAIDAADNAVHAGRIRSQATFVPEMWRLNLPSNVVVLMTTRTHRAPDAEASEDAAWIALSGFDLSASAIHLRRTFAEASTSDCESFHEQTAGNPRLQFYLLSNIANRSEPLASVLANAPRTPDDLFRGIVEDAVERVAEPELAKRMLATMLAMSRPVRVATLADVCAITLDTAERFCSGLEPGVRREESAVALRDEEFEAHLLQRASAKDLTAAHDALASYFGAREAEDAEAATEVAEHLKLAGRDAELVELALAGAPNAVEDPLRRFQTYQRRLELALGVTPPDGTAALKLLLLSAHAAGSDGAFATVIQEQPDLAVRHGDAQAAARIYLRQEHRGWQGATHYRLAAMHARAGAKELAREQLDLANAWMRRRQLEPERGRWEWRLGAEDIAAGAEAVYWLNGAKAAADWLGRWRPGDAVLEAAGHLAKRLACRVNPRRAERQLSTLGLPPRVEARFHAAMWEAGVRTSAAAAAVLSGRVATELSTVPLKPADASWSIPFSELLASRPATRGDASVILEGTPLEMPAYAHTGSRGDFDRPLRRESLRAGLAGRDLTAEELLPERLRAEAPSHPGRPSYQIEQERGKYIAVVRDLLLPASFRAEAILGRATLSRLRASVVPRLERHQSMRGHRFRERSDGFIEWVRTFTDALARIRGSGESLLSDVADVAEDAVLGAAPYAWLTMAEVLMPRQRYRELAVRLADRAAAFAEQHEQPASERMAVLLRAAEITDPWDANAAADFYQRAVVAAEGLDDDGARVLDVHATLARRVARGVDDVTARSIGERVSAALERFETHVSNTDLLPYRETLKSLAVLCPPAALALASRWDDELRLPLSDAVPELTVVLSQRGYLAPEVSFLLLRLAGESDAVIPAALRLLDQLRSAGAGGRQLSAALIPELDLWIRRDLPLPERKSAARELTDWLATNGLAQTAGPELKALLIVGQPRRPQKRRVQPPSNAVFGPTYAGVRAKSIVPNFDRLGEQLDELCAQFADERGVRTFLEAAAATCPVSGRTQFLKTITELDDDNWLVRYSSYGLVAAVEGCLRNWSRSPAVAAWARASLPTFLGRAIVAMTRQDRYPQTDIDGLLQHPTVRDRVPEIILEAVCGRLHEFTARHLYRLSQVLASSTAPSAALEILEWSLARQEDASPSAPRPLPADPTETLAAFLWALFGNPSKRVRWRALHAARAICKVEPTILATLMSKTHRADAEVFAPPDMTFYSISARVSVLTLVARLAVDSPELIRPYIDDLASAALDPSFPHVVIRELAKSAATSVIRQYPDALDSERSDRLAAANLPSACYVERGQNPPPGRRSRQSGGDRFRFDSMDTLPYWYEPLGRVLGITVDDVASRAQHWIVDVLGFSDDDWWHDRRETRSTRNWETMHNDHGSIPQVESLLKYLEFHGMLLAAGEAIDKGIPVAEETWEDAEGAWISWLGRFLSPERDWWMADLRSPAPVESWIYDPLPPIDEWGMPTDQEFEERLWGSEEDDGSVTVAASMSLWEVDRHETTHVSTALVSPSTAAALMRALQSSDASNYWFPSESEHDGRRLDQWEIDRDGFQFLGWCEDISFDEARAEEHDPFRRIGRTFEVPGRSFRDLLQLTADPTNLGLRNANRHDVSRTILWSDETDRNRSYIEERQTDGWRTRVRLDSLPAFLRRRRLDLLIEVRIQRNKSDRSGSSDDYTDPVSRIFLLRRNGRLETMAKSGGSRSVNRAGARRR